MRHEVQSMGQLKSGDSNVAKDKTAPDYDFVLEKSIFSNVFEKDIRRVFIYKKAERLAKAIYLIAPAFQSSGVLHDRISAIAIALIDAAILPPYRSREALSQELLALSSVLAVARTSGALSAMNADLISREAQYLLQEVAAYEEPRVALDVLPSIADLAKTLPPQAVPRTTFTPTERAPKSASIPRETEGVHKGHIKDRRESVLSVIRAKGQVGIKDITHLIRGVSEKTIQRELATLVEEGLVRKQGERRWSTYSLP